MVNFKDVVGKNNTIKNTIKRVNGVAVEIKSCISVDDFANAIHTVANTCFNDGTYHAENREIARRFVMLKYFTDIEVAEENINDIFKYTQSGSWFADIERDIVKFSIWAEIEQSIDRQIDYIIETRQTAFDNLCTDLSAIITTDNSQNLADVKEVLDKINKVDKQEFVEAVTENVIKKTKKK